MTTLSLVWFWKDEMERKENSKLVAIATFSSTHVTNFSYRTRVIYSIVAVVCCIEVGF